MKKVYKLIAAMMSVFLLAAPCMNARAAAPTPAIAASNHAIVEQVGTFDAGKYVERLGLITSPQRPTAAVTCITSSDGSAAAVNTAFTLSPAGYVLSRSSDQALSDGILSESETYDAVGNVITRSVNATNYSYNQDVRYTYNDDKEVDCQYIAIKADGSNIYYKYDYYERIISFSHVYNKESHFTRITYKDNHIQNVSALNGLRYVTFTADDAGRIIGYQATYSDLGCSETASYTYNEYGCLLTGVVTRTGDGGGTTTYITTYIY